MAETVWVTVADLEKAGQLLVQDGNHGEYRPRRNEFVESGVAFIRAADMSDGRVRFDRASNINEVAAKRITKGIGRPGDVILSHKGTVGKVALAPDDAPLFVCSPQTTFWRTLNPQKIDRRYLYVFLRSPIFRQQLASRAGETDMAPYVSLTSQRGFRVALPPIEDQRRIGVMVGALDDKIEMNRRMNETLEAMARAIFKDWFVDFGPTRAKMEGCRPDIAPDVCALFPDRMDAEGQPEGWIASPVRQYFSVERGLSYKGDFLSTSGTPMVNLACFKGEGLFDGAGLKYYTGAFKPRHAASPGTLLIANTDLTQQRVVLGSPYIVDENIGRDAIFSHHVYALRPRSTGAADWTSFFYFHLLRPEFRARARGFATGTTVLFLPKDAIEDFEFAMPPANLRRCFDKLVAPLRDKQRANEAESRTLAAIRDLLLPKLMSGQIHIRDAEAMIAAAA